MFLRSKELVVWRVRGQGDLVNCILNSPSPKNLVIHHHGRDGIMGPMARYLWSDTHLRSLHIYSEESYGIRDIAYVLAHSNRTLEDFGICYNKSVSSYTLEFSKVIKQNPNLRNLDLQNGLIDDKQLEPLAEALPGSAILGMNLSHNKITTAGAKQFLEVLAKSNLLVLNLENNPYFSPEEELIGDIAPIDLSVIREINEILRVRHSEKISSFRTSL